MRLTWFFFGKRMNDSWLLFTSSWFLCKGRRSVCSVVASVLPCGMNSFSHEPNNEQRKCPVYPIIFCIFSLLLHRDLSDFVFIILKQTGGIISINQKSIDAFVVLPKLNWQGLSRFKSFLQWFPCVNIYLFFFLSGDSSEWTSLLQVMQFTVITAV